MESRAKSEVSVNSWCSRPVGEHEYQRENRNRNFDHEFEAGEQFVLEIPKEILRADGFVGKGES